MAVFKLLITTDDKRFRDVAQIFRYYLQGMLYRSTKNFAKKYSCLIKRKMNNKRGIFKIKIGMNYQ